MGCLQVVTTMCMGWTKGPESFVVAGMARWEGRPKTPPLSWENAGQEAVLSPTTWLEEMDLAAEGLAGLQDAEQQDAAAGANDLARVREVLLQHAGKLPVWLL
eukprot:GHRR01028993.1.p3 GENE.GHRR01028993.1~~GHRR01028993.1.p3  ORF type:complete len:103 (+),score=37.68 GHRR01028993.1:1205-1513(+)